MRILFGLVGRKTESVCAALSQTAGGDNFDSLSGQSCKRQRAEVVRSAAPEAGAHLTATTASPRLFTGAVEGLPFAGKQKTISQYFVFLADRPVAKIVRLIFGAA